MKSVFFFFLFWGMEKGGKGCQAACFLQREGDSQSPAMETRRRMALPVYRDLRQLCSAPQVLHVKCPAWARAGV